jgi:hypothetical protein
MRVTINKPTPVYGPPRYRIRKSGNRWIVYLRAASRDLTLAKHWTWQQAIDDATRRARTPGREFRNLLDWLSIQSWGSYELTQADYALAAPGDANG